MTHEHGSEYQVRIVHEDETEDLSGWMNCQEDVAKAITGLRGSPAKTYWLQVRNIRCLHCPDRELTIAEFRLSLTRSRDRSLSTTDRQGSVSSRTFRPGASRSKVGAMSAMS
jgi:hypothetical protein